MSGLETELEAKLADPSLLSDPRDAAFAHNLIKAVGAVRDNLQAELAQREYGSARAARDGPSGLISGKYFCNLVKNPETVAKLSDFGFNTGDVDVLKDVHRRICNDQSPNYHQPLSKSDVDKMFAAVQGLQQELEQKRGKLGGTNAAVAQQTIGALGDVRKRLQVRILKN